MNKPKTPRSVAEAIGRSGARRYMLKLAKEVERAAKRRKAEQTKTKGSAT